MQVVYSVQRAGSAEQESCRDDLAVSQAKQASRCPADTSSTHLAFGPDTCAVTKCCSPGRRISEFCFRNSGAVARSGSARVSSFCSRHLRIARLLHGKETKLTGCCLPRSQDRRSSRASEMQRTETGDRIDSRPARMHKCTCLGSWSGRSVMSSGNVRPQFRLDPVKPLKTQYLSCQDQSLLSTPC